MVISMNSLSFIAILSFGARSHMLLNAISDVIIRNIIYGFIRFIK